MDAVFAYAHAFERYAAEGCGGEHEENEHRRCTSFEPAQINSASLVRYLRNVSFTGARARLSRLTLLNCKF